MVTKLQLAYIAGFVDGEGQLSITRHKTVYKGMWNGKYSYHARFHIYNNNLGIMKYIQRLIGGIIDTRKPRKENHNISYRFVLSRQDRMLIVLRYLIPLLRVKKKQALLLYEFLISRKTNRYDGFKKKEVIIYIKVKELNKKGPRRD